MKLVLIVQSIYDAKIGKCFSDQEACQVTRT